MQIELENIGAVTSLTIPLPEKGGVVVLKGDNGAGKSTTLSAAQRALQGKGGLAARDGTPGGSLTWGDVKLLVARSTRRTGELSVAHIEGRFDLASLVNGDGIKDPAAADSRRIKALVALGGVKADPALFYELAGGKDKFEAAVSPSSLETTDLVDMAAKVKRDLESAARKKKDLAAHEEADSRAIADQIEGIEVTEDADADALQAELETALRHQQDLETKREAGEKAAGAAKEAQAQLDRSVAEFSGLGVDEAYKAHGDAQEAVKQAAAFVADLKKRHLEEMQLAERSWSEANEGLRSANKDFQSARQHATDTAGWQQAIEAATGMVIPDETLLMSASGRVSQAREAVEQGVRIRDAQAAFMRKRKHDREAEDHRKAEQSLRAAASATDDVLSRAVASEVLSVSSGRLVTATARGKSTPYHELSDGERYKLAIDAAVENLPKGGLLVIGQDGWQDLSPKNRTLVADHAIASGVTILTAQVDDGELRAEAFGQ
jgi:energy-coupling factor transporter ATP-binding protein EcfA2